MYAIYFAIYQCLLNIYIYLYQAICKFLKFKRDKWDRYLEGRHIIVIDQGGGGSEKVKSVVTSLMDSAIAFS